MAQSKTKKLVSVDLIIDRYKSEMRRKEPITPPSDRVSLLKIYDRLMQRHQRRSERDLRHSGDVESITNQIIYLVGEEVKAEEAQQ